VCSEEGKCPSLAGQEIWRMQLVDFIIDISVASDLHEAIQLHIQLKVKEVGT
jgi:hypothetical protein